VYADYDRFPTDGGMRMTKYDPGRRWGLLNNKHAHNSHIRWWRRQRGSRRRRRRRRGCSRRHRRSRRRRWWLPTVGATERVGVTRGNNK